MAIPDIIIPFQSLYTKSHVPSWKVMELIVSTKLENEAEILLPVAFNKRQ